jgi:D-aspartate ligase
VPSTERNLKPEAIVVGSGLNALGVVRSLAPEDISITVLDHKSSGPAMKSRFATPEVYPSSAGRDGLIDHLLARTSRAGQPFLFLTQEASVAAVSENRERLQSKYRFVMAPKETMASLMDKSRFQTLAAQRGFPVPQAVILQAAADVERAAQLTYPCILKPVAKSEAWEQSRQKAYRFEGAAALREFFANLKGDVPALIVQEWIEGTDSDVYFTLVYRDAEGNTVASFTGRKLRQWPPQVGGTASCIDAPEAAETLTDLTTRFFDAVGFVGLGSMEYKRDPRSGRFVMVEPTVGRSDYQQEVATLNGVNIVRQAYRAQAGLPPLAPAQPSRRKVWRDPFTDERSRQAQPALPVPAEAEGAQIVDALFRMNDPGPWLSDIAATIAVRLARLRR